MSLSLFEFLEWMDGYDERVPLERMKERMRELDICLDDVREFVRFSPDGYRRNLMHAGTSFHALILCWKNGQRSPIHDHRGSSCCVRVLSGTATETRFLRNENGHVYALDSRELPEGGVCGSELDDLHQVSNLASDGNELITLHVYSPPLLVMGTYSLTDRRVEEFVDPIFEFASGAGI